MQDWLSKLHEFFFDQEPFVVATVGAFQGSSPEIPGVALFHSHKKTHRFTRSDLRYQAMLETAADMLVNPTSHRIAALTLGTVAGSKNGQCDVIYEYFDGRQYPDWLRTLRSDCHDGISSTLVREFDYNPDNTIQTTVLRNTDENKTDVVCWIKKKSKSIQLLRTIQRDTIVITLIGNHPVADEIQKQCANLPLETVRLKSVAARLSDQSIVIIMTADHELDYRSCEALLKAHTIDDDLFVGCLGSKKKAQIFHKRLLQSGISKKQLGHLHMPVGLTQINGKQNAVIAASIIAQVMTRHDW